MLRDILGNAYRVHIESRWYAWVGDRESRLVTRNRLSPTVPIFGLTSGSGHEACAVDPRWLVPVVVTMLLVLLSTASVLPVLALKRSAGVGAAHWATGDAGGNACDELVLLLLL